MKKTALWITNNILFLSTLFLLAFIPLYPKLPLLDVKNTWVYIRIEDFAILSILLIWLVYFVRKKVSFRTPLTLPILAFWLVGAIATIHGVILVFPSTANIFPNVAFLNFLRHIEYLSLFFVAYAGMRDKRFLKIVIAVLVLTLLGVVFYGFGQKYFGLPAYLTMNEEFAKGIPIQLSILSRVPSTFAGHYDLAAYLVLVVPIVFSLVFGFKNLFIKAGLFLSVLLGFILMFMTVSRVSFFVLLLTVSLVLFFQKKRFVLYSIPIFAFLGVLFFLFQPSLFQRFGSTISEVDVLVDAKTGESIGHLKYVPPEYFADKTVRQQYVRDREELGITLTGNLEKMSTASPSSLLSSSLLTPEVPLIVDTNVSTGEDLPQGTGYINLSLSPVTKKLGNFFYELTPKAESTASAEVLIFHGDFLVKRVAAYDLSFTTRVQGEWPNAIKAFEKNILVGSGYGSVSLAVDNNYLRILGETGILGIISFVAIFLSFGVYVKKILPKTESKVLRSFVFGLIAGVVGLAFNATLIDVFEASKVAFVLWILIGVTLGALTLYQVKEIRLVKELLKLATSSYAVVAYIFILVFVIYSPMVNNYFVGDDFTWFRWASDCSLAAKQSCRNIFEIIWRYFTESNGFFYRPGTKIYFLLMYSLFWLNQVVFHAVSLFLHFVVAALFFAFAKKVLKDKLLAALGSLLFIVMSGYSEIIFWTAATGHMFNAVFILTALLLFIQWEEKRRIYYFLGSVLAIFLGLFFHELGVVAPILIILYRLYKDKTLNVVKLFRKVHYVVIFIPVAVYLLMRFLSQSHWSGGDYSYNLIKLPLNIAGNFIGYVFLVFAGPLSLPIYQQIRDIFRNELILVLVILIPSAFILIYALKLLVGRIDKEGKGVILLGLSFFVTSLLPFIALGNITSRYSYLASLGLILIIVYYVKKLYVYLIFQGKDIALGSIGVLFSVFLLLHLIQVQQSHNNWRTSGEIARRFFISIDALYSNLWSRDGTELHFVDVPIRHKEAWVFPVGLEDAVWLTFQNSNLRVFIHQNLENALDAAGTNPNKWVLQFESDGTVKEVYRVKDVLIIPSRE